MKNILKGKVATVIILLATFVLAGVAIFTAVRLYQLRQTPVAPNVPSSIPRAADTTCSLSFTLASITPTPTSTASATPTATATATSTATATPTGTGTPNTCNGTCGSNSNCGSDLICSNGYCRNPSCTGETDCTCPSSTSTATATAKATTSTSTATPAALPQSGTNWPTVFGIGIGILTIAGALLLAL